MPEQLKDWIGEVVVIDTDSRWIYIGRLSSIEVDFLVLEEADAHDITDTLSTREEYLRTSRLNGVVVNRRKVLVRLDKVVGISKLEDIVP